MQNGVYSEEINTSTDIDPNLTIASDIDELEALNGTKVNYYCEGVEVDLILNDKLRYRHGGGSGWNVQNGAQVKWARNNIATTMERFEPTGHSHPTPSTYLEYGLAATVVASLRDETDSGKILNLSNGSKNDTESQGAVGSMNHVYSYACYEPGVQCRSNIPQKCKNEQIYSGRNLLPKGFRSKASCEQSASLTLEDRHTYATHYGTMENLYEEVSEKNIRKALSHNRVSTSANCVKEELLRVQYNHFRVLEELNLSLEALIMPPIMSSNIGKTTESFVHCQGVGTGYSSAVVTSNKMLPQNRRKFCFLGVYPTSLSLSSHPKNFPNTSLEDFSETFRSEDLKYNAQHSSNKDEIDEEDLDSGFSGSGISSGASYSENLGHYKTSDTTKIRGNISTNNSCCSPPSSIVFTTKYNTTSKQATSAASKQLCEDLLRRKTDDEVTSLNDTHRYLDMYHLYIQSTPAEILTDSKSKTNFSERS